MEKNQNKRNLYFRRSTENRSQRQKKIPGLINFKETQHISIFLSSVTITKKRCQFVFFKTHIIIVNRVSALISPRSRCLSITGRAMLQEARGPACYSTRASSSRLFQHRAPYITQAQAITALACSLVGTPQLKLIRACTLFYQRNS